MSIAFREMNFAKVLRGGATSLIVLGLLSCSSDSAPEQSVSTTVTPTVAEFQGPPARVRRMTSEQYANTIHHIFGDDIRVGHPFAPLPRTDGLLATGAATIGTTIGELQQLQRSATSIAAQVIDTGNAERRTAPRRNYLIPCKPQNTAAADDACAEMFIKRVGRLLYRRTLSDEAAAIMVANANRGATDLKDFYAGLATVIEGMLIDPNVLLIADTTEPDPNNPGKRRLDAYSLASRLSFFLWNAAPDDAVLQAAERGELHTRKGRERVVNMMMASPRFEAGVRAFFDDMFGFEEFAIVAKDPTVYPMITARTLMDAREQTLRTVVDHLVVKNKDYRDLFTTRSTFMSPFLAPIYQVPPAPGWVPHEFAADSPRVGVLSQVSFLALHSHPARSSATKRGKAVRELLLCQRVPSPPPNVDFSAVENPDARLHTARERLNVHNTNPVCAGCHKITDPMGLALENFDGAGRYREAEKGMALDISGTLDGKAFTTVQGFGEALRENPALPGCLVRRIYSYGTGGPLPATSNPAVTALTDVFGRVGYRVSDLIRIIATSDAFAEATDLPPPPPIPARTASATPQGSATVN